MKKYISLVVLASLLSTAAVKAEEGADPTQQGEAGKWLSCDCIVDNAVIKYIREFVTPTTAAVTAGTVVVGLALWKCSWIRRKLGLEDEDTHRSEEFNVEKLFATNYKK